MSTLTPKSDAAQNLVRDVRAVATPTGTHPLVGVGDAVLVDSKHSVGSRLPLAVAPLALTTFLLLFLFTGGVVQPVRALLLNMVSLGATLGFTAQPMDVSMTMLMFCVAFGLSMDYEVFVTSRIKELHDLGEDNESAVTNGHGHTGRIVTAAACLLAVSFFPFGTAKLSFMQPLGLVCAPFLRKVHERFGLSEGGPASAAVPELATESAHMHQC